MRDRSFSNEHKEEQRNRVLRFVLDHHRAPTMRYFGLPGLTWAVERDLMVECGTGSQFVGIECNWSILERSVPWMPGAKPKKFVHDLVIGEVHGYQTTNALAMFAHLDSFLSITGVEVSGPRRDRAETLRRHKIEKRQWRKRFCSATAIWLDLTSTVKAASTQRTLRKAFLLCHVTTLHVPIVVTLTYGRERGVRGGLESREEMIASCFGSNRYRSYRPVCKWHYESNKGGRMATFCGILSLRTPGSRAVIRDKRWGGGPDA